jgi:hypothetical protein
MDDLDDLFREIEKHFKARSKDPTYSLMEQALILDKVVPEWLLRGQKLLRGTPEGARCEKAVDALRGLHAAVWPKVEFHPRPETQG